MNKLILYKIQKYLKEPPFNFMPLGIPDTLPNTNCFDIATRPLKNYPDHAYYNRLGARMHFTSVEGRGYDTLFVETPTISYINPLKGIMFSDYDSEFDINENTIKNLNFNHINRAFEDLNFFEKMDVNNELDQIKFLTRLYDSSEYEDVPKIKESIIQEIVRLKQKNNMQVSFKEYIKVM